MITINNLWESDNEHDWRIALENYWSLVRPENIELERDLNDLKLEKITSLDPLGWYDFLHDKYFRWKYTAPNRYASTTLALKRYKDSKQLHSLFDIKKRLLTSDISDIFNWSFNCKRNSWTWNSWCFRTFKSHVS